MNSRNNLNTFLKNAAPLRKNKEFVEDNKVEKQTWTQSLLRKKRTNPYFKKIANENVILNFDLYYEDLDYDTDVSFIDINESETNSDFKSFESDSDFSFDIETVNNEDASLASTIKLKKNRNINYDSDSTLKTA